MVPVLVGALLAAVISWLGLNDWRFPWVHHRSTSSQDSRGDNGSAGGESGSGHGTDGGLTAPVRITKVGDGGVDVNWSVVHNKNLHGYDLYVTAVRPVEYEYGVPRYRGDRDVTQRIYPQNYLNKALKEAADPRRVKAGQVWHVCVEGMKDMPLNVPIDKYIIPGTKACSPDFTLP